MASESVSSLILFIASLVVAAGVAGTLTTGVQRVSSSIDDGSLDTAQQVRTDVEIINDPARNYAANTNLTLYVRNTGSQGILLRPSSFNIVFNGKFVTNDNIQVTDANGDGLDVMRENDVAEIVISDPQIDGSGNGDNRVFLTVNGDEEVFEFRV